MRPRVTLALLMISSAVLAARPATALWPIDYHEAELWTVDQIPARQVISCEDGEGGSFVIADTGTGNDRRVRAQRIGHSGRLLWGPDGRAPSLFQNSTYEFLPISACPDGKGGVYYASVEYQDEFHLAVTYIGDDGFTARTLLDSIGLPFDAELVSSVDGDAILVMPDMVGDPGTLFAVRLDSTFAYPAWNRVALDPFEFPVTGPDRGSCLSAASDGHGGVLIAAARLSAGGAPTEVAYQRITHDGIRAFAPGGIVVDDIQTAISSVEVEAAEFDAAYVVIQDAGSLEAHHVSGGGVLDWPSPVSLKNTAAMIFMETDICSDGVEGLYSVASDGDLHVNHVAIDGTEIWGPGGISVLETSGVEGQPRIVQSDWSGAILTWINEAPAQPDPVRHLAAMRVDYDGFTIWSRPELFREDGIRDPALLRAVKDRSGGMQLAWTNERVDVGSGWQDVRALGLDDMGNPPTPRVDFAAPAASEYGQVKDVLLAGDYLDSDTGYRFEHVSGSWQFPLNDPAGIDRHAVEGWIHPRQVVNGSYHLQVTDGPVLLDQLSQAYTLGPAPVCDATQDLFPSGYHDLLAAELDDSGDLHMAWTELDSITLDVDLLYRKRSSGTWGPTVVADPGIGGLSAPSMAIDQDATVHLAYLYRVPASAEDIRYMTIEDGGSPTVIDTWSDGLTNGEPQIAIDPDGTKHIVYLEGVAPGDIHAKHLHTGGPGLQGPDLIMSDPGLIQFQLGASENGVVMVYEELIELPLYRIAYRKLDGGVWGEEVELEVAAWAGRPDVAWDGQDRILFIWNRYQYLYGGSLLGTRVEENGILEDLRSLYLDHTAEASWIASSGPERFHLATDHMQPIGPSDDLIFLRHGDGRTFGTPKLIQAGLYASLQGITAGSGNDHVLAYWLQDAATQAWECDSSQPSPTAADDVPAARRARLAAHPNPFNGRTQVLFELVEGGRLTLDLFDLRGRKVSRLAEGEYPAGPHEVPLVTGASAGLDLASGVYVLALRVDERAVGTAKVVLVK